MSRDTKYLPASVVATALPRLQQAVSLGDPTALATIKQWGFESIARVYDPDPIFRPHHYLMKKRAETEWRHMLEAHERRLEKILLEKAEEAWKIELEERILDRQHQGAERRRRDAEGWNRTQRVGEHKDTRGFETDEQIRLARALAEINGPPQRQAPDEPPQVDAMERVRQLQAEIARIEADPTLKSAAKHRQTVPLQESIRDILGERGRGR